MRQVNLQYLKAYVLGLQRVAGPPLPLLPSHLGLLVEIIILVEVVWVLPRSVVDIVAFLRFGLSSRGMFCGNWFVIL